MVKTKDIFTTRPTHIQELMDKSITLQQEAAQANTQAHNEARRMAAEDLGRDEKGLIVDLRSGCTGRFGFCVFDDEIDPCQEECLFCYHPQERK